MCAKRLWQPNLQNPQIVRRQNNIIFVQKHTDSPFAQISALKRRFERVQITLGIAVEARTHPLQSIKITQPNHITPDNSSNMQCRDIWGFSQTYSHTWLFSAVHADLLCWDLFWFCTNSLKQWLFAVVRPGWKKRSYKLEVVVVLLHQLVQQGGFFFGPACYCSYHLLLKWQAHFQRLSDIENQRNVFALNMEFQFAQRVMWFMWLVQQYICSQVMKLGLPANIIQRLNYFRFKEELCVFIVLSAETDAASRSQNIQKQLEGKTIVYLQKHSRFTHLPKYKRQKGNPNAPRKPQRNCRRAAAAHCQARIITQLIYITRIIHRTYKTRCLAFHKHTRTPGYFRLVQYSPYLPQLTSSCVLINLVKVHASSNGQPCVALFSCYSKDVKLINQKV
ncbi:Hypothetical_protein [Hexamita inflata]|uniref:Hypothetical_protein n=1 Tax=Hexamita inflata TaxID=28002 RepID=A0AA86RID3_9EUKA|nr:Hypothetical protein HINF_LOCUS61718 [Hexamita inflata]